MDVNDLRGKVLWTGTMTMNVPFVLDMTEHAAGSYFIRVVPAGSRPAAIRVQKVG